jgi:hypothetical protein
LCYEKIHLVYDNSERTVFRAYFVDVNYEYNTIFFQFVSPYDNNTKCIFLVRCERLNFIHPDVKKQMLYMIHNEVLEYDRIEESDVQKITEKCFNKVMTSVKGV